MTPCVPTDRALRIARMSPTMTPDQHEPVVRHIRLCQCGKPANHQSICKPDRTPAGLHPDDIERTPATFEDQTTERARARYERRRREFDSERRQHRATLTSHQLHTWITKHAAQLSTVPAGQTERSRPDAETRGGVPAQQLLDDDPRWREHMTVIRRRLELAASLIDELEGHGTVASTTNMLGAEKDKLILSRENEGLRAQAVVDRLGSHIAGSAATVRRVRQLNGLDPQGYERENPAA